MQDPLAALDHTMIQTLIERARSDLSRVMASAWGDDDDDDDGDGDGDGDGDDDDDDEAHGREPRSFGLIDASRFMRAKLALRFAATAAALCGDASMIPTLIAARGDLDGFDDEQIRYGYSLALGLARLAWRQTPPAELVMAHDETVRRAIAHGLRPQNEGALALLDTLVRDPDPCVRAAARKSLPPELRPPPWLGTFAADPGPLDPALVTVLADFDGIFGKAPGEAFIAAWEKLPGPLRVDSAERLVTSIGMLPRLNERLVDTLVHEPGGEHGLVRLLARLADTRVYLYGLEKRIGDAIGAVDAARKPALAAALRGYLAVAPNAAGHLGLRAPDLAAELLLACDDASPSERMALIEARMAITANGEQVLGHGLHDLARGLAEVLDEATAEVLLERCRAGWPGRWSTCGHHCEAALVRVLGAARVEPVATELVAADGERRMVGGRLAAMLGRAEAPLAAVQGASVAELGARRQALRDGQLAPSAVVEIVRHIDWIFGGRLAFHAFNRAEDGTTKPHALAPSWPDGLSGPRTADEDARLWAALPAALTSPELGQRRAAWHVVAHGLSVGPWQAHEREAVMAAAESALAEPDAVRRGGELGDLALALAHKGTSADVALLLRIAQSVPDDDLTIADAVELARERFGAGFLPRVLRRQRDAAPRVVEPLTDLTPSGLSGLPRALAKTILVTLGTADWQTRALTLDPDADLASADRRARGRWLNAAAGELVTGALWALADTPDAHIWRAAMAAQGLEQEDPASTDEVIAGGLTHLFERLDPGSPELVRLIAHRDVTLRRGIAEALDPLDPRAREHLFGLVDDVDAEVREAAREALKGYELPWWRGHFARDPLATLSPEEAAAHMPRLLEIHGLLSRPGGVNVTVTEQLGQLLLGLPDVVIVDLAPRLLADDAAHPAFAPIVAALVSVEAGYAALEARVARLDERKLHDFEHIVRRGDDAFQAALSLPARRRVAQQALTALKKKGAGKGRDASALRAIHAGVLAAAWVPGDDPSAVLEAWLRYRGDYGEDAGHLKRCLASAPWVGGWACTERLMAAARAGWVAPLQRHDVQHLGWLEVGLRRELALALRHSPDELSAAWALEQLLGDAHRAEDGPVSELVSELIANPQTRALMLSRDALKAVARDALLERWRAGLASLREAAAVIGAVTGPERAELAAEWRAAWRRDVLPLAATSGPARLDAISIRLGSVLEDDDRDFLARAAVDADVAEVRAILWQLFTGRTAQDVALGLALAARFPDDAGVKSVADLLRRHGAD